MLLAAIALQASIAAPIFAPPVDTPLRILTERTEAAPERHYRLERLVRFNKEGNGYRAEALILGSASEAPQPLGNLVERGLSALAGRKIVLHLDSEGRVVEVDEIATLWERVCQRISDAAATRQSLPPGEARKLAEKVAAPLRALPPERQRALLATLVTAAIISDPLDPVGTVVPIKLPGTSPFGTPIVLEGTRRTAAADNGLIRTTTLAAATMALPTNGQPAASGSVALERVRTSDPRTGLIANGLDTLRNGTATRQTVLVTRLSVARANPSDWPD
ncbi:hypothetical protein [Sphingomonas psychrotolerans]|uniref:Uncharacterized protein n=1 Tax=Sphingomonas psychrotolerans TaxID=1327635 RepID=A0A2K8MEF0_9SPHN|nr:hypothetical protein [Sphingomonas psychrotolerans]ATY32272.1 hypothetical protein CVN68_10025 [Sphingomonas psychrotolerans]